MIEADSNKQAKATQLIRVTPQGLRDIAQRIETLAQQGTLPREAILYPATSTLTLVYYPEESIKQFLEATEMEKLLENAQGSA